MESKANYVAVGAFVLIFIIGLVVTLLWAAGSQYSQEYTFYQTNFDGPVTGLGKGTLARYNGIEVGRITDLQFDPKDPKKVIVTLEVRPNLGIREDSVASIESQGLTGASYVEISGGSANSPLLVAKEGQDYPVIKSIPSTMQQLEQSAPEVVAKLNIAVARVNDLLNDKNRAAIAGILSNLNETTTMLARRSGDIDGIFRNTNQLTATLKDTAVSLKPVLDNVNVSVSKIGTLADNANVSVIKIGTLADDADTFINGDGLAQVTDLVADTRTLVTSLTKFSDQLNRQPTSLLFGDRRKGYTLK